MNFDSKEVKAMVVAETLRNMGSINDDTLLNLEPKKMGVHRLNGDRSLNFLLQKYVWINYKGPFTDGELSFYNNSADCLLISFFEGALDTTQYMMGEGAYEIIELDCRRKLCSISTSGPILCCLKWRVEDE